MNNQKIKRYISDVHDLFAEWNWDKNGNLDPNKITAGSGKKVWWKCDKGHEWQAMVRNRSRDKYRSGCPICGNHVTLIGFNDLVTTHPEIAKQWHPTKNGNLKPTDVVAGSGIKVWWLGECGHEWEVRVISRVRFGSGCPTCAQQQNIQRLKECCKIKTQ